MGVRINRVYGPAATFVTERGGFLDQSNFCLLTGDAEFFVCDPNIAILPPRAANTTHISARSDKDPA